MPTQDEQWRKADTEELNSKTAGALAESIKKLRDARNQDFGPTEYKAEAKVELQYKHVIKETAVLHPMTLKHMILAYLERQGELQTTNGEPVNQDMLRASSLLGVEYNQALETIYVTFVAGQ